MRSLLTSERTGSVVQDLEDSSRLRSHVHGDSATSQLSVLWRKGVLGTIYELKIPLSHLEFIEPRSKRGSVWDIVPTLRTQSECIKRQLIQLLFQLIE